MNDTIAAVSTAPGVSAISIIRLSGENSISIINQIFKGKDLTKVDTHTIHYGHIMDREEMVDEVLVTIMKSPRTFTTEDIVEINCHGGIMTTKRVLELVLSMGARLAEPGEFTRRAFLYNRIDLTEAEGIMDLISAKTEKSRKLAMNHVNKGISKLIHSLRDDILKVIANIEVNIDYPEYEDILVVTNEMIELNIENIRNRVLHLIKESENSRIINEGIQTAIIGRPNVGKSSLLNQLLEKEKAIVTEIPGTTRDIIEAEYSIDGILLHIMDTAGIRTTEDKVEKIGIKRSFDAMDSADLILFVLNHNEELTDEDLEILDRIKTKKAILFVNKSDLERKLNYELLKDYDVIKGSMKTGEGVLDLKNKIKELFHFGEIENSDFLFLSNVRQITLLKEVGKEIEELENHLKDGYSVDILEINLKRIWDLLGDIIGSNPSDELTTQLFSQFCLGK